MARQATDGAASIVAVRSHVVSNRQEGKETAKEQDAKLRRCDRAPPWDMRAVAHDIAALSHSLLARSKPLDAAERKRAKSDVERWQSHLPFIFANLVNKQRPLK